MPTMESVARTTIKRMVELFTTAKIRENIALQGCLTTC
jgi:hypothetical protein